MSLLEKTALPYQAPYFSQIKSEDFAPALLEAMTLRLLFSKQLHQALTILSLPWKKVEKRCCV